MEEKKKDKDKDLAYEWKKFLYDSIMRIETYSRIAFQGYEDMDKLLRDYNLLTDNITRTRIKIANFNSLLLELRYIIDNAKNNFKKQSELKTKINNIERANQEGRPDGNQRMFISEEVYDQNKKMLVEIKLTKLYEELLNDAYKLKLEVIDDLEEIIGTYERGIVEDEEENDNDNEEEDVITR